jgi:hypothetical protein
MIKVATSRGIFLIDGDSWEMEESVCALVLNVTKGTDDDVVASFHYWDYVMLVEDDAKEPVYDEEQKETLRKVGEFLKDPSSGVVYERPRAAA